MSLLYPKIPLDLLPAMLGYASIGALVAGVYGVVHDQITYSLCPEYFTRLKFQQFGYADFGLPPRFFVAEIGFLASWWVGFVAGWFLARVGLSKSPPAVSRHYIFRGFTIILCCGCVASLLGFAFGLSRSPDTDYSAWQDLLTSHAVIDAPAFVRVAHIHNSGYLGALIGLIIALVWLARR